MNNIEKLIKTNNKNCILFVNTVLTFKNSKGFYYRLYNYILKMEEPILNSLIKNLKTQNFRNTFDVAIWLEK